MFLVLMPQLLLKDFNNSVVITDERMALDPATRGVKKISGQIVGGLGRGAGAVFQVWIHTKTATFHKGDYER